MCVGKKTKSFLPHLGFYKDYFFLIHKVKIRETKFGILL